MPNQYTQKSEIMKKLIDIFQKNLNITLNVDDNILEVKGNSLVLSKLAVVISSTFDISFDAIDFFSYPTIDKLANYIKSKIGD